MSTISIPECHAYLHVSYNVDKAYECRVDLGLSDGAINRLADIHGYKRYGRWKPQPLTFCSFALVPDPSGVKIQFNTKSKMGGLPHKIQFQPVRADRLHLLAGNKPAYLTLVTELPNMQSVAIVQADLG